MSPPRPHVPVTCLYLIASPLQYLAARRIAEEFEAGARQVLIYYKKGVAPVIRENDWDAVWYMPWPRFYPLPGPFGEHRRLLDNLERVADLAGPCDTVKLHAAMYDSEVTNYFLRALPPLTGAERLQARILPDGIISVRRYPLTPFKRGLQYLRKLRRLVSPRLNFWCFGGDRLGTDASFVDRIYVLPGLPHQYPPDKVVQLPPLAQPAMTGTPNGGGLRALIIGQPLVGYGLTTPEDLAAITTHIHGWLRQRGVSVIDYKGHPKDPSNELMESQDQKLELNEPIETYMTRTPYDFVVGVRSSALLFARQIYGADTQVVAFDWDRIRFKSAAERKDMEAAFLQCGVRIQ